MSINQSKTFLPLLFGSKTRVDLLALFMSHPGESFYIRQLASLVQQSPTPVIRELVKLEQIGLLTCQTKAKTKCYTVNTDFFLFPELKSMLFKTAGIGDEFRKCLKDFSRLSFAFIYGSFATKEAGVNSDIDLFFIGEVPVKEITKVFRHLELKLRREIQYSIFDKVEFFERLKKKDEFILQIVKGPKIMLIGDENEFRRLVEKWLD